MAETLNLIEEINQKAKLLLSSKDTNDKKSMRDNEYYKELEIILLKAIYPDLDSFAPIKIKDSNDYRYVDNIDYEEFSKTLIYSLQSWKAPDVNDCENASFKKYFETIYEMRMVSKIKKGSIGTMKYSDWEYRISKDVEKLMNTGLSREKAIDKLKNDKHAGVRETTWNDVRNLAEGRAVPISLDAEHEGEEEKYTLSEIIGAESPEIEAIFDEEGFNRFMEVVHFIINRLENKVKKRIQMQDCCTFFMLKGLKTENGKPYDRRPPCNGVVYDAYKKYEHDLMNKIFSKGIIEATIKNEIPLSNLYGIANNFLKEGVFFEKKELSNYWNFKNQSQASRIISKFEGPFKIMYKISE